MQRKLVLVVLVLILLFSLKPVLVEKYEPFLLSSYKLKEDKTVRLLKNEPTTYKKKNSSFETIHYSNDKFSDEFGFRPYPWGKEIFEAEINFYCDRNLARTGNWSFQIESNSLESVGALAVPDFENKPLVDPDKVYYLSFWINYDFEKGKGIRLCQQFFIKGDYWYPTYAVYGPFITGSSNGEWEKVGLLVEAPPGAIRGDPVLIMSGQGEVNVDDAYFGEAKIKEIKN